MLCMELAIVFVTEGQALRTSGMTCFSSFIGNPRAHNYKRMHNEESSAQKNMMLMSKGLLLLGLRVSALPIRLSTRVRCHTILMFRTITVPDRLQPTNAASKII